MKRVWHVAAREFVATVFTPGFLIGLLLLPALISLSLLLLPRMVGARTTPVEGEVVVEDPTGSVAPLLSTSLSEAAIVARRAEATRRVFRGAPVAGALRQRVEGSADSLVNAALGSVPKLTVVAAPAPFDLEREKARISARDRRENPLALLVVHADAVTAPPGQDFGTYDLFLPANADDRVETAIYEGVREVLISARTEAAGVDRADLERLMRVPRTAASLLTGGDEPPRPRGLTRAIPFIFGALLLFGVMMGGQGLVTSMVEEKSSRVVEVLLSAVSPLQLMAGKILGQMAVSAVVLSLYIGIGVVLLTSFALAGLVDLQLIIYFAIFFVITYLTLGSLMVAAGAAVNEMREAQSLMMPLTLATIVPWLLAAPISRDPDSTLSVAFSFVPPMNTFAMLLRMTSTSPPPTWQVWLTIAIGVVGVAVSVWFAAKVFRVGLLMHGKPPNLMTLLRWVRAA